MGSQKCEAALEAVGAGPTGSALDQSLGNVIATSSLQNSCGVLPSQGLQWRNSADSTGTKVKIKGKNLETIQELNIFIARL